MRYSILPLFLLISLLSFSQTDDQVKQLIFQKDSLFWVAYNNCNIQNMDAALTDDIEFYHDKGGPSFGRDTLMTIIRKIFVATTISVCAEPP
jgi:hypothetical protein